MGLSWVSNPIGTSPAVVFFSVLYRLEAYSELRFFHYFKALIAISSTIQYDLRLKH